MTTRFVSKEKALEDRKWLLIDAEGQTLGRLASKAAGLLRGKHKPDFTPHVDCGDFVIVINASKIKLTGNKANQKKYYWHSGYVGGIKEAAVADVLANNPDRVITSAIKGMLPKGKLGRALHSKLKVYGGAEHPHVPQKPEVVEMN